MVEENPQVRVASYSNTTWQGAWRQRSRAVWGTGLFGILWGAGIGGILTLGLAVAGVGTFVSAAVIVAGCAAAGGGIGIALGDSIGTAAGATGAGLAEWESRFKQMMVDAKLFDKSMVQKEPVSSALNRTEMVDTPEEVNLRGRMFKSIINWPAMITFVTLGAVLGATLGFAGLFTAPLGLTALATSLASSLHISAPVASALIGGTLVAGAASAFGVNSPVISNHFNNLFSKVFSNEAFTGKKKAEMPVPVPEAPAQGPDITAREALILQQNEKIAAAKGTQKSFQDRLVSEAPSQQQLH